MSLSRKSGSGPDTRVRPASPFRILSFDPGGTTGVASSVWNPTTRDEKLTSIEQIQFRAWHLTGDHHFELWDLLNYERNRLGPDLEIVCESFQFRQHINRDQAKTKVELMSVEYIGIIKLFCEMYSVPLTFNTASTGKTFIPDKGPQANVRIKQLGLYQPGMVHAMDATRHLLRYIVVNKKIRSPILDHWI